MRSLLAKLKQEYHYFSLNLEKNPKKKRLLITLVIFLALPVIIVAALTAQNYLQRASGNEYLRVFDKQGNPLSNNQTNEQEIQLQITLPPDWVLSPSVSSRHSGEDKGIIPQAYAQSCSDYVVDNNASACNQPAYDTCGPTYCGDDNLRYVDCKASQAQNACTGTLRCGSEDYKCQPTATPVPPTAIQQKPASIICTHSITISGGVKNQQGQGVPGAKVCLDPGTPNCTTFQTTTDSSGTYIISGVNAGGNGHTVYLDPNSLSGATITSGNYLISNICENDNKSFTVTTDNQPGQPTVTMQPGEQRPTSAPVVHTLKQIIIENKDTDGSTGGTILPPIPNNTTTLLDALTTKINWKLNDLNPDQPQANRTVQVTLWDGETEYKSLVITVVLKKSSTESPTPTIPTATGFRPSFLSVGIVGPTLESPDDNTIVDFNKTDANYNGVEIIFRWNTFEKATGYRLIVSGGTLESKQHNNCEDIQPQNHDRKLNTYLICEEINGNTKNYANENISLFQNGTYTWWIEAILSGNDSISSQRQKFLVKNALAVQNTGNQINNDLATPTLLSPEEGAQVNYTNAIDLLFKYNTPNVQQYQIQVAPFNNDGPGVNFIVGDRSMVQASRFTVEPPRIGVGNYLILPGMTYYWRVRTSPIGTSLGEHDPGWSRWSAFSSFRTTAATSSTISPVYPSTSGMVVTGLTPTLQWKNSNPNIFYYEIQISRDIEFIVDPAIATMPVSWELVHGGETFLPNGYLVRKQYPLDPDTTYYWRLRPRVQGDGKPVEWSDTWNFKTPSKDGSPQTDIYSTMQRCWRHRADNAAECTAGDKKSVDLNSDGKVDEQDYKLFLQSLN